MPLDEIEDIIAHNQDVIVIVDEAYVDFGGHSAQQLLSKYENLLVVQTFSKSRSMAGIRIGYALGSAELIKALNDVKYSFNSYTMNRPSILLGTASVEDDAYFKETVEKIVHTREWFKAEMKKLGFTFPDSQANFLFASHPDVPAKEIFEAARANNIYVRYFDKPRINNYLRITIGTDEEMKKFYLENREKYPEILKVYKDEKYLNYWDIWDILEENKEIGEKLFEAGHKIGGYPNFTQSDVRDLKAGYNILLLQIDSEGTDEHEIIWGDFGIANFFIREKDLKELNFDEVIYNWDCC